MSASYEKSDAHEMNEKLLLQDDLSSYRTNGRRLDELLSTMVDLTVIMAKIS